MKRWYDDPEFQLMCEGAEEIQRQKYKDGWNEGDRVWDGEKVRVVGFDFLNLANRQFQGCTFYFAVLQDLGAKVVFEQEVPHGTIKAKTGEYRIMKYHNPIYLPSQEDLQEMVLTPPNTLCPDILTMLRLFNVFAVVSPQFTSMNQLWLAFVYHELYQKKWNPEKKEWEKTK